MESLLLILPIAVSIGTCVASGFCFRNLNRKITSLEQTLLAHASDPSGHGPMPMHMAAPPMTAPPPQYAIPQGYGYQYYPNTSYS